MLLQYDAYWTAYYASAWMYYWLWLLIGLVIWLGIGLACAYFVYKDARGRKGVNAVSWAILCLLSGLIGLLIYLLVKNAKT